MASVTNIVSSLWYFIIRVDWHTLELSTVGVTGFCSAGMVLGHQLCVLIYQCVESVPTTFQHGSVALALSYLRVKLTCI